MGKKIITQVQETQRVPNRINPRRNARFTKKKRDHLEILPGASSSI